MRSRLRRGNRLLNAVARGRILRLDCRGRAIDRRRRRILRVEGAARSRNLIAGISEIRAQHFEARPIEIDDSLSATARAGCAVEARLAAGARGFGGGSACVLDVPAGAERNQRNGNESARELKNSFHAREGT